MASKKTTKKTANKSPKTTPNEVVPFASDLVCVMSDDEVAKAANELARLIDQETTTSSEFDAVRKSWKTKLEDIKRQILVISAKVRERQEVRSVRCERTFDFASLEMREVRLDTGEVFFSRPLNADERQTSLIPFPEKEKLSLVEESIFDEADESDHDDILDEGEE